MKVDFDEKIFLMKVVLMNLYFTTRPGRRGSHTTAPELQTCTFEGPGASNTTKIPRKDPKRQEEERKLWREREKKARNFGPHPSGPHFFWVRPHPSGPHHDTKNVGQKIGLAKIGLAKIGSGQNWPGQNHDGQKWIGQNWSNQDGQNGIGQSRLLPLSQRSIEPAVVDPLHLRDVSKQLPSQPSRWHYGRTGMRPNPSHGSHAKYQHLRPKTLLLPDDGVVF